MEQLDLFKPATRYRTGSYSGDPIPQSLDEAKKLVYDFQDHVLDQKWRLSTGSANDPIVWCIGYVSDHLVLILFEDGSIDECGPYSLFPVLPKK